MPTDLTTKSPTSTQLGSRQTLGAGTAAFVLAGLCVVIALARLLTYHEPFERDITGYAVIGHELNRGEKLYTDVWDIKPPGVYATYATVEMLVGYGDLQIYVLGVGAAIATMLGVYYCGVATRGGRTAGLWAAGFWTALCSDIRLEANQPNVEVFINAALIWATAMLLRLPRGKPGNRTLVVAAMFFTIASFYKHYTGMIAIFALLGLWLGRRETLGLLIRRLVVVAAIAGIGWGLVFAYFSATSRGRLLFDTMFKFGQDYAGSLVGNLIAPFTGATTAYVALQSTLIAAAIAVLAIPLARPAKISANQILWAAYALGVYVVVCAPGKFWTHYFQFFLPVIVVAAGWGTWAIGERFNRLRAMPGTVAIALTLLTQLPLLRLSPEEISVQKANTDLYIQSKTLGKQLKAVLKPEETFYNWGGESGLFYWAKKPVPVSIFMAFQLFESVYSPAFTQATLQQLDANPPEMVVVTKSFLEDNLDQHPVVTWVSSHYRPFALQPSPDGETSRFFILVRKGGRIDREGNAR